jgi:hypothetical protein
VVVAAIWQRYNQLGTFSRDIYSYALNLLFGEMYDAIRLKLSPQEEDEIQHHFFSDEIRWA